ncbi:hypothetical protein NNA36_02315 [Shimia sp. CNT1-13L.2]|uniref:hypothetical protein n=1 Tax=Shimia sp. CNT1-13L.2 TaxID=2959663 RepID=UPI0020CEEFAA|nr:hypothetical protein [Shimia sp. CNT1-13L.2]MCP9480789.1 hypothetical protein [Shimia sp. CNT1-13L.2]
MQKIVDEYGDLSCEISSDESNGSFVGTVKYRTFEVGVLSGEALESVRSQFRAICGLVDAGGMVRHGIIMTGYHNGSFSGDVLLIDGEIIGEWSSDDEEWCYFTASSTTEVKCTAPSPWMLHDAIAKWMD